MTKFWRNLEYGQQAEQLVGDWLRFEKIAHLPLFQFGALGRAPYLSGCPGELPCPDFICWGQGGPYFIECKRKEAWGGHANRRTIGLKSALHKRYLQVSQVTRAPVYYYFVIEKVGVFGGEVSALDPAGETFGEYTNFPSDKLTEVISSEHHLFAYWDHDPEELDAAEWKQQAKAILGNLFVTYGPEYASSVMSWVEKKAERVARKGRERP
ncbi:hypothetical protein WME75_39725 [Sorangium sp. So ce1014]|uniref:hypothetical protein n=1 Tax=Sorangium sp. So ce1014 TaxID=3133326 RepID=UPI003F61BF98